MKAIIILSLLLSSHSLFASQFVSAALCQPTEENPVKSIEVFYDDEESGFVVLEVLIPDAPSELRVGRIVKVIDNNEYLQVGDGINITSFKIKKNDSANTFTLDGVEFSCKRADW